MRLFSMLALSACLAWATWTLPACSGPGNNNSAENTTTDGGTSGDQGTSFQELSADGYTTVSDVISHNKVPQDIGDIEQMLAAGSVDWTKLQQLYEKGKHSVKGDGSIRTLNGFASTPDNFKKYSPEAVAFFKTQGICQLAPVDGFECTEGKFVDEFVESYAINGKGPFADASDKVRGAAVRAGLHVLMGYWVRLEFGKAIGKAKDNNYDAAKGSPHNWDEAFAFYWGPEGKHSLYALANKLSTDYQLSESINAGFFKALIDGLKAQVDDKTPPQTHADAGNKQLLRLYILAALDAAKQLDAASSDDEKAAARWLGFGYWLGIGHAISKADASAATTFADVFFTKKIDKDAFAAIKDAVKKSLTGLGMQASDFGTALQ